MVSWGGASIPYLSPPPCQVLLAAFQHPLLSDHAFAKTLMPKLGAIFMSAPLPTKQVCHSARRCCVAAACGASACGRSPSRLCTPHRHHHRLIPLAWVPGSFSFRITARRVCPAAICLPHVALPSTIQPPIIGVLPPPHTLVAPPPPPSSCQLLVKWWSECPAAILKERVVKPLQAFLTKVWCATGRGERGGQAAAGKVCHRGGSCFSQGLMYSPVRC